MTKRCSEIDVLANMELKLFLWQLNEVYQVDAMSLFPHSYLHTFCFLFPLLHNVIGMDNG